MLDFTNCKRLYDRVYNGANGKKIAIEYEGEPYMLKFPPSGENKPTELSYTNSCISEHIAMQVVPHTASSFGYMCLAAKF